MTALPGSVMLDELYIPGSHETLALHYPLLSSLCQTLPLASQLSFGIRFLDLRFNLTDKGELWAYHGLVPQRRRAEEVFEEIYEWLESAEGRGETVIISVKQENDTPPEVFASTLLSLIQSTAPLPSSPSNRTPASFWYTKNEWPRLGDVRGKAVLFCRFAWRGYGLHPVSWPNDQHVAWTTDIGGRESLVQDWYGVRTPLSLPLKASLCLSLFDAPSSSLLPSSPSSPSPTGPRFPHRISFLSCATFPTLYPSTAAKGWGLALRWPWSARRRGGAKLGWKGVNELVLDGLERLDEREEEKGRGRRREEGQGGMCVLIDFVEFPPDVREGGEERRGELVERVIECNFR
ncbi:hypothetical protein NBRC10512v2_001218 [Rhodotorula toruloides]